MGLGVGPGGGGAGPGGGGDGGGGGLVAVPKLNSLRVAFCPTLDLPLGKIRAAGAASSAVAPAKLEEAKTVSFTFVVVGGTGASAKSSDLLFFFPSG